MIRFPSAFFGWHSYEFNSFLKGDNYCAFVEKLDKKCKIVLSWKVTEKNHLECKIKIAAKGIKSKHLKTIRKEFESRIKSKMQETSKILLMRRKSLKENSKNQENAYINSKKRKLDKIINPEKYYSKSPSVRKVGGNTSSNPIIPELGRSQIKRASAGSSNLSKLYLNRRPQRG